MVVSDHIISNKTEVVGEEAKRGGKRTSSDNSDVPKNLIDSLWLRKFSRQALYTVYLTFTRGGEYIYFLLHLVQMVWLGFHQPEGRREVTQAVPPTYRQGARIRRSTLAEVNSTRGH
jgi:hypothetical protein